MGMSSYGDRLADLANQIARESEARFAAWVEGQGDHVARSASQRLWHSEAEDYARWRRSRDPYAGMIVIGSLPRLRPWVWTWWRSVPQRKLPGAAVAEPVSAILAPGCPEWALKLFAGPEQPRYVRMLAAATTRDPELLDALYDEGAAALLSIDRPTGVLVAVVENPACPLSVAERAVGDERPDRHLLAGVAGNPHLPDEVRVMAALRLPSAPEGWRR